MLNCSLCPKTFSNRVSLVAHTFSHTKEKPHKCLTCSATFGHRSNLQMHIRTAHSGIKIVEIHTSECPLCGYKCKDITKLKAHLRKHSEKSSFSCSVPSCSFKTKSQRGIQGHVRRVHLRETPYECQSDGCNYKTSEVGNLSRHLKVHSNKRPFACKVPGCNYTAKTKPYLITHVRSVHSDEKPWKCLTCGFQTKLRTTLNTHQAVHSSTKRFHCQAPHCRYASNSKSGILMHFGRKHRKKEISCTEPRCKYRCGTSALLKIHLKDHKLPILKCPHVSCNFSTKFKSGLRVHIFRYHKDKLSASPVVLRPPDPANVGTTVPVETRHCTFPNCSYHSDFPHRYDNHMKTHDKKERRKYVCKICSSRFTRLSSLDCHIQRHIGEKPYSCSHCAYTTVDGGTLRFHAQRVHKIFVIPRGDEHQYERTCCTCNKTSSSYSEFMLHSMTHLKPVVLLERLRVRFL